MFCFICRANVRSGGAGGSRIDQARPFISEVCTDFQKINMFVNGMRYGINEKIFVKFTGYLVDPNTDEISMEYALVRLLEPKCGRDVELGKDFG